MGNDVSRQRLVMTQSPGMVIGNVWNQRPAQEGVDLLMAAADSQNGDAEFQRCFQQNILETSSPTGGTPGIARLPGTIQIGTAGKYYSIQPLHQQADHGLLLDHGQQNGNGAIITDTADSGIGREQRTAACPYLQQMLYRVLLQV